MARQSKCVGCKKSFDTEELTIRSNKKYCSECLEEHDNKVNNNKQDWDLLFEYICEKYKIDKPNGMMFKQLKDYRTEYQYTNIGMYYTLKYYYDVLENDVLDGSGLGIIPYFYDKAKRHYAKVFDIADIVESYKSTEKQINIKIEKINTKHNIQKPISLEIAWGDGQDAVFNDDTN